METSTFFFGLFLWIGGLLCGIGIGTSIGVDTVEKQAVQIGAAHYDTITREFKWNATDVKIVQ